MYYKFKLVTCPLGLYITPPPHPTLSKGDVIILLTRYWAFKNILNGQNDNYLL